MRGDSLPVVALVAMLTFPVMFPIPVVAQGPDPSRLYGRVTAMDGSVYEGFIRWDGNEAGWFDILHASKPIPERNQRDAERLGWEPERRRHRIEIFGVGISLPAPGMEISSSSQSGIRFGHVSSLETWGSGNARVLLRSGGEAEFRGGGDLGSSVGEILVADVSRGEVRLEWSDLRAIDFLSTPDIASAWGERIYGTLVTRYGERITGYVVWDMDELYSTDILDGEEGGRERDVPFSRIRGIERYGSSAARVHLVDGTDVVLRGTNDVNSGNRDILVADPALGEVRVTWEAFDRVELTSPPSSIDRSVFDYSGRLWGTVRARGGETRQGWIRWDNDEEFAWEILDGRLRDGVDLDIEFSAIRTIERVAYAASRVTLRDGRSFELTDSNDIDENNRGIYVERADGTMVLVPWDRFERVDFEVPPAR